MFNFKNSCDAVHNSLDVRFTKACDNNCEFCIEKTGIPSFGKPNVLEMAKNAIATNIDNMLVLGGEPFLYPEDLRRFISLVRPYFKKIYITTSLPATFDTKYYICENIIESIDGLNVSIHSIDDNENNYIFKATSEHSRLTILKTLNRYGYANKIRVSITLIRGGIDNKDKLIKTLDYLKEIGVKHVKINELQHTPKLYVSYEKLMDTTLKSAYACGCNTYIQEYSGMQVLLKRSCFLVEPSLAATWRDLLKILYKKIFYKSKNLFKVLYENGEVCNNWRKGV